MAEPGRRPAIRDNYDRYLWGVLIFVIVLVATVYLLSNFGHIEWGW